MNIYRSHRFAFSSTFKQLTLSAHFKRQPVRTGTQKPKSFVVLIWAALLSLYTQASFSAVAINYNYDDLNRLTAVTRADDPVIHYGYDEVGNFNDQAVSQSPDTDSDGVANFVDSDDDNDSLPDSWEQQYNLDPLDPADAGLDPDGDGVTNLAEFQGGTDPHQYNNSTPVPFMPAWAYLILAVVLGGLLLRRSIQQGV